MFTSFIKRKKEGSLGVFHKKNPPSAFGHLYCHDYLILKAYGRMFIRGNKKEIWEIKEQWDV